MNLNEMRADPCRSSELLSWDRRCGGKPHHHRVKGTAACVSWCVASRTECGGRAGPRARLLAAAPDYSLVLIADHVPRALPVSGSAAGS